MQDVSRSSFDIFILGGNRARAEDFAGYLTAHGCRAEAFGDKAALLSRMEDRIPGLVLLQAAAGSPASLLAMLADIRKRTLVPCILHAQEPDQVAQRVHGLENGVDDWIPATTARREVLARIRAVLRRATLSPARGEATSRTVIPTPARQPRSRNWHLSVERRELFAPDGSACLLTYAEFDLLWALARSPGAPVAREVLSKSVFGRPWHPEDRGIDNLVARLRRKLGAHSHNDSLIKPVRGVGYLFTQF